MSLWLPDQIPLDAKPEFETSFDYEDPVGKISNNTQKFIRFKLERRLFLYYCSH